MESIFEFSRLIKDKTLFDVAKTPPSFLFREDVLKQIAYSISKRSNLLTVGATGTGKTASVKYVSALYLLEHTRPRTRIFFIACASNNTAYKVLYALCKNLGKSLTYKIPLPQLIDYLKQHKHLYLILDEADKIKDFPPLVKYMEILNIHATFTTNNILFPSILLPEITSRLGWQIIQYAPYTAFQITKILDERIKQGALYPNVSPPTVTKLIGAKTTSEAESNMRIALQTLYIASKRAEQANKRKIDEKNVVDAFLQVQSDIILETLLHLPDDSRLIILALGTANYLTGNLYERYTTLSEKFSYPTVGYTTFWKRLNDLERDFRLIATRDNKGRGQTRRVFSTIPTPLFKQLMPPLCESLDIPLQQFKIQRLTQ